MGRRRSRHYAAFFKTKFTRFLLALEATRDYQIKRCKIMHAFICLAFEPLIPHGYTGHEDPTNFSIAHRAIIKLAGAEFEVGI